MFKFCATILLVLILLGVNNIRSDIAAARKVIEQTTLGGN